MSSTGVLDVSQPPNQSQSYVVADSQQTASIVDSHAPESTSIVEDSYPNAQAARSPHTHLSPPPRLPPVSGLPPDTEIRQVSPPVAPLRARLQLRLEAISQESQHQQEERAQPTRPDSKSYTEASEIVLQSPASAAPPHNQASLDKPKRADKQDALTRKKQNQVSQMQNLSRLLDSDSDNGDEAQRRQNSPAKKIQPVASKTPQTTSRSIKLKDRLRQTAVQGPVVADTSTSAKAKSKSATLGKSPSKQTPLMSKDTAVKGSVKTKVKPASSSTARSKTDVSSERLQGLNTSTTTVEEKAVDAEDLEGEDIS
ncbi:hypothetical protein LTR16_007437, partial [Cryomyces antarcticus]